MPHIYVIHTAYFNNITMLVQNNESKIIDKVHANIALFALSYFNLLKPLYKLILLRNKLTLVTII